MLINFVKIFRVKEKFLHLRYRKSINIQYLLKKVNISTIILHFRTKNDIVMLLPYLNEDLRIIMMRLLIVLTEAPGQQILLKFWITRQSAIELFKGLATSTESIDMAQLATILLNKMRYCTLA